MVMHVIHALSEVDIDRTVVVVGHGAERVTKKVQEQSPGWAHVTFVEQTVQRGTGDAAMVGMTAIPGDDLDDDSTIIVLPGDTPLLRAETLQQLVATHISSGNAATAITAVLDDPTGLRTRAAGTVEAAATGACCRWSNSATPFPRSSPSARCGRACARFAATCSARRCAGSAPTTPRASTTSPTSIEVLAAMGHQIGTVQASEAETRGVNDRWQLALAERELRHRTNRHWLLNGVTMLDPRQTFIDVTVQLGRDVTLYPGTILQGNTVIGDGCEIGPDTRLVDCVVGARAVVENSVGRDCEIGADARVGPYAHLAPGASVPSSATTGAFYTAPAD